MAAGHKLEILFCICSSILIQSMLVRSGMVFPSMDTMMHPALNTNIFPGVGDVVTILSTCNTTFMLTE